MSSVGWEKQLWEGPVYASVQTGISKEMETEHSRALGDITEKSLSDRLLCEGARKSSCCGPRTCRGRPE